MKAYILFALGLLASAEAKKHHSGHHSHKHAHHIKMHELQQEIEDLRADFLALDADRAALPYGQPRDKDKKVVPGSPALPSPQPFIRGEKQWWDNSDNIINWQDRQWTVANDRIPYYSTLAQEDDEPMTDFEKDTDMSILYEKDDYISHTQPEKVINLAERVPIALRLLQLNQDDDPKGLEKMMMEDPNIPLNLRF